MDLVQQMEEKRERLSQKEKNYQKALLSLPDGRLTATKNGKFYKYYQVTDGVRSYLPKKEKERINELAKKQYLLAELKDIHAEMRAIDLYLKYHKSESATDKLLSEHLGIAKVLEELLYSDKDRFKQWMNEDYPANAVFPNALIHPGPFGKMYRSKTEADIAFLYVKNSIPFRYEWIRNINGTPYPIDFTTLHPKTGKTIFWEHFGRMDDPLYTIKIGNKLLDFESKGIFPGINLILTFESKRFPINSNRLDEIIQKWYFNN